MPHIIVRLGERFHANQQYGLLMLPWQRQQAFDILTDEWVRDKVNSVTLVEGIKY